MRRVAALCVALVATLTLVAPVSAAPANRVSDTEHILACVPVTGDGGTLFLFAAESEQSGSFAEAAFWPPGADPETIDPAWIAIDSAIDFSGSSVAGTISFVEFVPSDEGPPFGDPVGDAVLDATLTPDGDAEPYRFQDKSGNQVFRREGTFQLFSVEGTLTMPNDTVFDLSECQAATDTFTEFSNAPASSVFRSSSLNLGCSWETEEGFIGLFAAVDFGDVFSDLTIVEGEEQTNGFPTGPVTLTTEEFAADYEILSEDGDPLGTATASATLTPAGRINETFSFENQKTHIVGDAFNVDGSLSITLEGTTTVLPMDETSCSASDVTVTDHFIPRQEPKGRPLPNDAPDGALPIAIGETVTVSRTGGTDADPEAPCVISDPQGDFEVPLGHTAWWTFTGTGSDVTVDTAGSSIDTVVGVYVEEGGSLTQVGCVDDVEDSLQARITVSTEDGVAYLIQVGGFGGDTGSLVVSLE